MVNICKLPINVVNDNKPKMLTGLAKRQAAWFGGFILPSHDADTAPPADRQDLNDLKRSDAFVQVGSRPNYQCRPERPGERCATR
jgi:hypothetical protein